MPLTPSLDELTLAPFDPASPRFPAVVQLYERVWPSPPDDTGYGERLLRRHAAYPGYAGRVALAPDDSAVGLAYGMTDLPGQWWHERVALVLGPEETPRSLTGSFALTSLAVDPAWRNQGLGARLHDELLARVPHDRATLSTQCDNPARRLYERLGWRYLVTSMRFDADGPEWVIMARRIDREEPYPPAPFTCRGGGA